MQSTNKNRISWFRALSFSNSIVREGKIKPWMFPLQSPEATSLQGFLAKALHFLTKKVHENAIE